MEWYRYVAVTRRNTKKIVDFSFDRYYWLFALFSKMNGVVDRDMSSYVWALFSTYTLLLLAVVYYVYNTYIHHEYDLWLIFWTFSSSDFVFSSTSETTIDLIHLCMIMFVSFCSNF